MQSSVSRQLQEYLEQSEKLRRLAEEQSPYKRGQRVRACRDLSFTLNPNPTSQEDVLVPTNKHDCTDPEQHYLTRVVAWDSFGRTVIAIPVKGDNPHCAEWCWTENYLSPITEGEDWVDSSSYAMGMDVTFVWEYEGFPEKVGKTFKAKLISPHIEVGDWFVSYQAYPETDGWITCVVNEKLMTKTAS